MVVIVIVSDVFLDSGRDVLVMIIVFVFVVLRWVSVFGFTPCSNHDLSSKFP